MGAVVLVLVLLVSCVVQGSLPCIEILGGARWPVLAAAVVYYALYHEHGYLLAASAMAGVMLDSLSLMPFGVSLVLFVVAGTVVRLVRDLVNSESLWVLCLLGGAVAFFLTFASGWWLGRRDLIHMPGAAVWGRAVGTGLLGCIAAPVVALVARWLDGAAGTQTRRSDVAGL